MRNLFKLLYRFHLLILFVALEIIALAMIIRNNNYQRAGYIQFSNSVTGTAFEKIGRTREYFSLKETNRLLAEENVLLRNQLASFYTPHVQAKDSIIDTVYHQKYSYLSARIINNSVNKQYNYITLNKGQLDGIKTDMAVISPKGMVGVVAGVSEHFSVVLPILNHNFKVSAKLKKNNFFGSLSWEGLNTETCVLTDIPHHVPVIIGDTVISTGFSGIFPEGIPIGTIKSFEIRDGNFYIIKVKLSADFRNLNFVTVIGDLQKDEQQKLEKPFQHD